MAASMSGPTKRSAQPVQGASSTSLPSKSQRETVGSSARAATNRDSATDLPPPGSPPTSRLCSGNDRWTIPPSSLTPTGIGLQASKRWAPTIGQGIAAASNGSRRTMDRVTSLVRAGLAVARTSRTPSDAAMTACARTRSSTLVPRRRANPTRSPLGVRTTWPTIGRRSERMPGSEENVLFR